MPRVIRARQSKGFTLIEFLLAIAAMMLVAVRVPDRPLPESGWVGKTVFVRMSGAKIDPSAEPREPSPLDGVAADSITFRVFAERPNHVQVRTRQGVNGWLRKDQVVLLDAELANQLQARSSADAVLFDDAVAYFTRRLEANPNDMDALNRRAAALRAKGELDAAIKDASETIRRNPSAVLYNNRAIIYHAKKDYDKAIADYAQAITLNPKYTLAYSNRAIMYHAKKDYDQAIADTTQAIQMDAKWPVSYRTRGISWYGKKDYDKAIEDLTQAIRLDPKLGQAYIDRANALTKQKEYAKALADLNEAQRLEPSNVATLAFWLVSCPEDKYRDGNRALELAAQIHKRERHNSKAMETLAAAHAELGRFDEAVRWQERALQDPGLKNDAAAQRRLELYREKQVFRQD